MDRERDPVALARFEGEFGIALINDQILFEFCRVLMHVCWPCLSLEGDGLVALSLPCEGSRPRLGGTAEEGLLRASLHSKTHHE